jgi:hypothetical protein
MSTEMFAKGEKFALFLEQISSKEWNRENEKYLQKLKAEYQRFVELYQQGRCHICNEPFTSFRKEIPCVHWFLKPQGFKKDDLLTIADHFGFFQIQVYLRWVANQEGFARHINDLPEEGSQIKKLFEVTIRYKDLEWSFSCAESDYKGHPKTHYEYPHYHFEMRSNQLSFIKFNDFHIPFKEEDIMYFEAQRRLPDKLDLMLAFGEGMNDILNENAIEALVNQNINANNTEEASVTFFNIAIANEGKTINSEDIRKLYQKSRDEGISLCRGHNSLDPSRTTQLNDHALKYIGFLTD